MNIKSLAIVAAGAGLVALAAVTAPHAGAATAVSAKAKTCAAVSAWSRHRTTANLDALMKDSFGATWKYLGEDADVLYKDVRGGKTKYVSHDLRYLSQDCS